MNDAEKQQQLRVAHGVTDGSKVTIDRAKLEQVLESLEMIDKAMPPNVIRKLIEGAT